MIYFLDHISCKLVLKPIDGLYSRPITDCVSQEILHNIYWYWIKTSQLRWAGEKLNIFVNSSSASLQMLIRYTRDSSYSWGHRYSCSLQKKIKKCVCSILLPCTAFVRPSFCFSKLICSLKTCINVVSVLRQFHHFDNRVLLNRCTPI